MEARGARKEKRAGRSSATRWTRPWSSRVERLVQHPTLQEIRRDAASSSRPTTRRTSAGSATGCEIVETGR